MNRILTQIAIGLGCVGVVVLVLKQGGYIMQADPTTEAVVKILETVDEEPTKKGEGIDKPFFKILYSEVQALDREIEEGCKHLLELKNKKKWYGEHPWKKLTDRSKYKKLKRKIREQEDRIEHWRSERAGKLSILKMYWESQG